jgi:hypothetical protein
MSLADEKDDGGSLSFHEQQALLDSIEKRSKREQIQQACGQKDVERLAQLADSRGGLLDDGLRQTACETPSFNPRL